MSKKTLISPCFSVPEHAPHRLWADAVSAGQISLVWTPLLNGEWNGGGPLAYVLQYRALSLAAVNENVFGAWLNANGTIGNDANDAIDAVQLAKMFEHIKWVCAGGPGHLLSWRRITFHQ